MNASATTEILRGALAIAALSVCLGVASNGLRRAPLRLLARTTVCPRPTSASLANDLHVARRATFVDVRPQWEYLQGHIEDAVHLPLADLSDHVDSLRPAPAVVIYGAGAEEAAELLCRARLSRVLVLSGGLRAWREAGGPVRAGALP